MARGKLYALILFVSSAGYAWLGWNLYNHVNHGDERFTVCLFKSLTGIPCPACGATRSIQAILQADISNALFINPLGFLLFAALIILPLWVTSDLLRKQNTFHRFYTFAEAKLAQKIIALPAIALITANWVWSICKHL